MVVSMNRIWKWGWERTMWKVIESASLRLTHHHLHSIAITRSKIQHCHYKHDFDNLENKEKHISGGRVTGGEKNEDTFRNEG
jgi:hypothetical protein